MNFNIMYKHINNTDVAFVPLQLEKESDTALTYYGKWYNIVNVPYFIQYDEITIKTNDLTNWKEYNRNVKV